jgi:hypothetical protein
MIQRDYIERLIQQVAEAVGLVLGLIRSGKFDQALQLVDATTEKVLGPHRSLLERLEATSAVELIGRFELDRLRLYAALLGEKGAIHELRGDAAAAQACYRHALELYAASSAAGARLMDADLDRIAQLSASVDLESLDPRYRDELSRVQAEAAPS